MNLTTSYLSGEKKQFCLLYCGWIDFSCLVFGWRPTTTIAVFQDVVVTGVTPQKFGIRPFHKFPSNPELRRERTATIRQEESEGEFKKRKKEKATLQWCALTISCQKNMYKGIQSLSNAGETLCHWRSIWSAKTTAADANWPCSTSCRDLLHGGRLKMYDSYLVTAPMLEEAFDNIQCDLGDCKKRVA